jgi:hypothetical protein
MDRRVTKHREGVYIAFSLSSHFKPHSKQSDMVLYNIYIQLVFELQPSMPIAMLYEVHYSVNILAPYGPFPLFCRIGLILFPRKLNDLVDLCFIHNRLLAPGCFLSFLTRHLETLGWAEGDFASRGGFETFLLTGFPCAAEDASDNLDTAETMGQLDVGIGRGFRVRHTCHRLPGLDT